MLKQKIIFNNKIMVVFKCEICRYETLKKYNFDRHIVSVKHMKVMDSLDGDVKKSIIEVKKGDMVIEIRCKPDVNPMLSQCKPNVNPMSTLCYPNSDKVEKDDNKEKNEENDPIECPYCFKEFTTRQGKWKHIKKYCKEKGKQEILLDKMTNLENTVKELAKQRPVQNIYNNHNKYIDNSRKKYIDNSKNTNYLNIALPNMLDMDTFIKNLMTSHKLDSEKTKLLLESFKTCGLISYGNNLSRTLKENCYQQVKDMDKDSQGVKMIPIVTTDSNLRSHKEMHEDGWRKVDNDKKLNEIINITNDQVYKNHNEPIYLENKDKQKIANIIKKDHGIGNISKKIELEEGLEVEKEESLPIKKLEEDNELLEEYAKYMNDMEDE